MASTITDLLDALSILLPGAELGEDNDGQLLIYTGKRTDGNLLVDMI